MVVPAALSAERLPAPSVRAPRVPMALSLGLHGLAILLLFAAGAAGSSSTGEQAALLVEVAFSAPGGTQPPQDAASSNEPAIELPPPEEPPPPDFSGFRRIELAPVEEPPPLDVSELKPVEPPKAEPKPKPKAESKSPAKAERAHAAAKPAPPRSASAANFGTPGGVQQAAAGFLPVPAIVWEGKPRYRLPPTPPVYPSRAIELDQKGEVVVRVQLDTEGAAVEIVLHRGSGHELLDRAALAAVRKWHFLPAVRDGRPVPSWVEIPVRFDLR